MIIGVIFVLNIYLLSMVRFFKVFSLLVVLLVFSQCKKEADSWTYCVDCGNEEWVGNFEGTGVYYSDADSLTVYDVPTVVEMDTLSDLFMKTKVIVADYFESTTTFSKTDDNYYIEVPGSNGSLSLTLSKKGSEYKLSGTVKQYHSGIIDNSISFDVYKK